MVIVLAEASTPVRNNGSSDCNGIRTVPLPPLVTRSSPWSKNWPKNVNIRLNGADRPKSGVMFGMNSDPVIGSAAPGGPQTKWPEPQLLRFAAFAAGLFAV